MKKLLLILILTTLGSHASAQNEIVNNLDNFGKIELGFHGLSFGYELPVSNKFVWENALGLGLGMNVQNNAATYSLDLVRPVPFLKSKFKFVYNINKRKQKDKNILNNGGNYVALQTKYSFGASGTSSLNSAVLTELHWGIQRNLGGRFLFSTHVGFGYLQDFKLDNGVLSPTIGLSFGYRIF